MPNVFASELREVMYAGIEPDQAEVITESLGDGGVDLSPYTDPGNFILGARKESRRSKWVDATAWSLNAYTFHTGLEDLESSLADVPLPGVSVTGAKPSLIFTETGLLKLPMTPLGAQEYDRAQEVDLRYRPIERSQLIGWYSDTAATGFPLPALRCLALVLEFKPEGE